jgi:hypothetical protein
MKNEELRFYCDDTFKKDDNDKWYYLIDYAFSIADSVEFNVLYKSDLKREIQNISKDIIETTESNKRGALKFKLSPSVKQFIKSKKYYEWNGYNLEDMTFVKNEKIFLTTITHENYIILETTEKSRNELKKKGFDFWCDWGTHPDGVDYQEKTTFIEKLNSLLSKIK